MQCDCRAGWDQAKGRGPNRGRGCLCHRPGRVRSSGRGRLGALGRRARLDRFGASPPTAGPPPVPPPSAQAEAAPDPESHITVTEFDYERLRRLIETWSNTRDRDAADALAD